MARTIALLPGREMIQQLKAGDPVVDAMGRLTTVSSVALRGIDQDGCFYVLYYTPIGDARLSCILKEDKLLRTVALVRRFSSVELDWLEHTMRTEQIQQMEV